MFSSTRSRMRVSLQLSGLAWARRVEGFLSFKSLTYCALLLSLLALAPIGLTPSGAANGAAAPPSRELLSLRSARSETFLDGTGGYRTRLYARPINYRSGNAWLPIDNSLIKSESKDFAFENAANSFHVHFKDSLGSGFMRFDAPGGRANVSVSLEKATDSDATKANDTSVSYANVRPKTDIDYAVTGEGLKETLILHDSSAPSSYVFDLAPADDQDLSAVTQEDGSIVFFAKGGSEPAFSISAPTVADSARDGSQNPPTEKMASMEIEKKSDGSFRLTVRIDSKWLSDPDRVFPVYLDPNYLSYAADLQDGFFNETTGQEAPPNTTATTLYVGHSISSAHTYSTATTFDLGAIPVGAEVTNVAAKLYLSDCLPPGGCIPGTTTGTVEMHQLTGGWSTKIHWSHVSVASAVLTSRYFNAGAGADPVNTWYQLSSTTSLVSTVQDMVNGKTPNFGFLFKKTGGNPDRGFMFASSRMTPNPVGPYLEVNWQTSGVALGPSPQVHANGADLVWTRWNGTPSGYVAAVLHDNPLHYWRLGESSGAMMSDELGTDTGIYYNNPAFGVAGGLSGDPNTAVSFDGATQVAVANTPVKFGSGNFTIEAWFKTSATGAAKTIFRSGGNPGGGALVKMEITPSNQLAFYVTDTAAHSVTVTSTTTVTDGVWHQAVATRSGNVFTLYGDNFAPVQTTVTGIGQTDTAGEVTTLGASMTSAAGTYCNYFKGSLDEISVYPQALFSPSLLAHYNARTSSVPTFQRYQVHRSTTSNFTPSSSTLIGEIADPSIQTFRDTTAKANTTFYYKVVVAASSGNYNSNEISAALPADGTTRVTIQPGLMNGAAQGTYIDSSAPTTSHGAEEMILASPSARALLDFDIRSIPSYATIQSAQLQMFTYEPLANATVDLSPLVSPWQEDATWNSAGSGRPNWQSAGGDFDSSTVISTLDNDAAAHWDCWGCSGDGMKNLVQSWVDGTRIENGFLLKHHTESGAPDLYWVGDDFVRSIALRPKLVVIYDDPSATVTSPRSAISYPAPSSKVSGTVTVKGSASDDGKVASVQFKLDGANLGSADTAAPYEVSWSTTGASRGSHTLTAVTTDDAGNQTTSSGVQVTVANSNAPTVSVTGAAPEASPNTSIWSITAGASDDYGVDHVDFLVDGKRFDTDTASPWAATLDTLAFPVYDGTHQITARAFDADGNLTTSSAQQINVANTDGTMYQGTISTSGVPTEMRYDPNAETQDSAPLTVQLQNTSEEDWTADNVSVRYRWLNPDGTVLSTSEDVQLSSDIAAGTGVNVPVTVDPPELLASVMRGRLTLRIDLYDATSSAYFSSEGNAPFEKTVTVTRVQPDELGLEGYQQYDGANLGSGYSASTNLYNGNLVVNSTLSSEPGIGLSTMVGLTYNSLENGSVSPAGNNWSLSVSGLVPIGLPLDVHPNAADTAAGRTDGWIGLTDADGTYHRFTLDSLGNFFNAPAGVHLYLRKTGSTYAATTPDRTTYNFDSAGYPTSVVDKDGNTLTFTETAVTGGNDLYGLAKHITAVTDQGGRSYNVSYYDKQSASRPALWGKVSQISDHIGHTWVFAYYDDGNLMSVTEQGGSNADGSYLADRSAIFDYTTPDGSGPAIATLAGRKSPDPATNQSTRLYSVIDARGNESSFAYVSSGAKQWRVSQITNRKGIVSSDYAYDLDTSTTTVSMPLQRIWTYGFDASGRPTSKTDPLDETTSQHWTDNQVDLVTEPTGRTLRYDYNANGLQTDSWDELDNHTTTIYENLPVEANDTGNHLSRITSTTKPVGSETTGNPSDYKTTYHYSDSTHDRVDIVTDALGNQTTRTYNANGTLASTTLPAAGDGITRTTTYNTYDVNGLATKVTDAAGNFTQSGYDAAGRQLWSQDANHQSYTGGDPTSYRSYSYYDSFGRAGRTSSLKSTSLYPGALIWNDTTYDASDNVLRTYNAHYGTGDGGVAPYGTTAYDELDSPTIVTSVRSSSIQTQTVYDDAGRSIRQIKAKGMGQTHVAETETSYDKLDRVYQTTEWGGSVGRTTTSCYDKAGDLRVSIDSKGSTIGMDCPAVVLPGSYQYPENEHSTRSEYDAAHRQTRTYTTDGSKDAQNNLIWKFTETAYDANGQTTASTDAAGKTTHTYYDDKGQAIRTVAPFETNHDLTTITEYDALGRVSKDVSAQAYDYANGTPPYTKFVTTYGYDALSRKVKTNLPFGPTDAYKKAVLSDVPSHYWRLGESSGSTAVDQVSGGDNGTYTGSPTLGAAGAVTDANTAATFNGSSQYVQAPAAHPASITGNFTVEVWAKPQNATANMNLFSTRGPSEYSFDMQLNGGNKIHGDIGTGSGWLTTAADASFSYQTSTWYQIVYVITPTSYTIYVNGKQVGSGALSGTPLLSNSTHNYYIGQSARSYAPQYFNGSLDEAAIYTRALSASAIKAHYDSGVSHYSYQTFDANGNQTMVSQETSATSTAGLSAAEKTTTSYLDSGSIYSTTDGTTGLSIRCDYTAEGWQQARWPDGTGTPGVIDYTRTMYKDYYPDGLQSAARDMIGQREVFTYDEDGNQTLAIEATGIQQVSQSPIQIERTFNNFDTATKIRVPDPSAANRYLATLYSFDANGNQLSKTVNRQEDSAGTQTVAGCTTTSAYDASDQVTQNTNDQCTPSSNSDDQTLENTYTDTGQLETQTLAKQDGTTIRETTNTYTANGQTDSTITTNAAGTTLQSDDLSYVNADGDYANGNQTSDAFTLKGPSSTNSGTATYAYDASGSLISSNEGTPNSTTNFSTNAEGDITAQTTGSTTTSNTYTGPELTGQTVGTTSTKILYDAFGNVNCTVTSTWINGSCPASGDTQLVELNTYDYKNRQTSDVKYNSSGAVTDSVAYTYDALDRVVIKSEKHGSSWTATWSFYEGDSTSVASEKVYAAQNPGGTPTDDKDYSYDDEGNLETVSDNGSQSYSVLSNPQSSVSLLLDQSGNVVQSYGYSPYGQANSTLTQNGAVSATLNPYRFQGKRLDSVFNTYDMGARRYSLTTSRWQQQDMYYDSERDAGLSQDAETANRYLFATGSPTNYMESDGHFAFSDLNMGTYNNVDAVLYALKYSVNYNLSEYDDMGSDGDCANFVSQALHAGGLEMNPTWGAKKRRCYPVLPLVVDYCTGGPKPAWVRVKEFVKYLEQSGHATNSNLKDVQIGDVIVADWNGDGDKSYSKWTPEHLMLVTQRVGKQIYISAHDKDRTNWPLLYPAQHPGRGYWPQLIPKPRKAVERIAWENYGYWWPTFKVLHVK